MPKYYDQKISWNTYVAKDSIPTYRVSGDKLVAAPSVQQGQVIRLYEGAVQTPWSSKWTPTPSQDGYIAIEKAPAGAKQVWASYKVVDGLVIPPVEAQMQDHSAKDRRVLIKGDLPADILQPLGKDLEGEVEARGQLVYDEFDELIGQKGPGDTMYPASATGLKSSKGVVPPPANGGGKGGNLLFWVLAGAAAAAGAPVAVPVGLAALGVVASKEA